MTELRSAFVDPVLRHAPRLVSTLDREPDSETFGSFDRVHWGWKLRDFPVTMLQYGLLPLAKLQAGAIPGTPYAGNERLLGWIESGVRRTLAVQRPDGGFDSVAPNAPDHGVSVGMAYVLGEVARTLGDPIGGAIREAVVRAADYGLETEEDYAFISNHQALVALGFHRAAAFDERFAEASERTVAAILAHQSPDGPFEEYGGADPGYESLGLFYLALLWRETRSRELLEALRRSVHFHAHCVHPDGSVGGVYGSRHTHVFHPGGFALLAGEIPEAAGILRHVGSRLAQNPVVTLDTVDAENLAVLLHGYVEAAASDAAPESVPLLPCEAQRGRVDFDEAGVHTFGTDSYYAVVSSRKGGVCRVHTRDGRLLHEDAGWVLSEGARRWSSQRLGLGDRVASEGAETLACKTRFAAVDLPIPTPLRFLLLRIANLTVFRWQRLGALLRRWIVGRLITNVQEGPYTLERKFRFGPTEVEILDRVVSTSKRPLTRAQLVREFTSIHMGSARYFHPPQLTVTALSEGGTLHAELTQHGEVTHRTLIGLHPGEAGSGPVEGPDRSDQADGAGGSVHGRAAADSRTEVSR